jgi:hypothetical protein
MEFLLARTIEWAREREVPEFSLNFSVFAQLILNPSCRSHSALRFAILKLDRLFQIDRLLRFNRKFFRSGARATSASRASSTSRASGSHTSASSRCWSRRGRGCALRISPLGDGLSYGQTWR